MEVQSQPNQKPNQGKVCKIEAEIDTTLPDKPRIKIKASGDCSDIIKNL